MIDRFVTIARHKNLISFIRHTRDSTQNSNCTSIYQKMCLICMIDSGCPFLSLFQDSFCMVMIIKSFNLCNIYSIRISHAGT